MAKGERIARRAPRPPADPERRIAFRFGLSAESRARLAAVMAELREVQGERPLIFPLVDAQAHLAQPLHLVEQLDHLPGVASWLSTAVWLYDCLALIIYAGAPEISERNRASVAQKIQTYSSMTLRFSQQG